MSRHLGVLLIVVLACATALVATGRHAGGQGADELNLVTVARIGGESNAIAADGSRVLLAEGEHVLVVDVSAPDAPHVVGQTGSLGREIRDIVIDRDTAFVASSNGVGVIDIADATAPRVLSVLGVGPALAVDLEDGRLYVVFGTGDQPWSPEGGRLHVFDVADPAAPRALGALDGVTGWWGVAVADGVAWVPQGSSGLVAIDARDPQDMREVSRLGDESGMRSPICARIDRERNRLYVAALEPTRSNTRGVVAVFDTSDPAAPRSLGVTTRRDTSASDCALRDGDFYVAQFDEGVEVHSTAGDGPTSLQRQVPTLLEATAVDAADGITFIVEGTRWAEDTGGPGRIPGLRLYDEATALAYLPTASFAAGVAKRGDVAYLALGASGVRAYDVSNPYEPRLLDTVAFDDGVAHRIALDGDVALVASGKAGVRIYDVSDRSRIKLLGEHGQGADVSRLSAHEGVGLAVVSPDQDVSVFEYIVPSAPREISRIAGPFADVSSDGSLALLTGGDKLLQYYDLADPTDPTLAGDLPSEWYGGGGLALTRADDGLALILRPVPGSYFIPTPPPTPEGPPTPGPSPTPTYAATPPPDGSGLVLVDGSDPRSPDVVASINNPAKFDSVAYHRGRAYVGSSWGPYAYDVSDPREPRQLRTYLDGTPNALSMMDAVGSGDLLYVATGNEGLRIVRQLGEDDPTPTATSTARGPGTLPPPFYTMTADAASTMTADAVATLTADAAATLTAGTPDVPINWQLYVPVAEAGGH